MKAKTILVKLLHSNSTCNSEDDREKFALLMNSDEIIAKTVCDYNIPLFISYIVQDSNLRVKDYAAKYNLVAELYLDSNTDYHMYLDRVLLPHAQEVIPCLSEELIDIFIRELSESTEISKYFQSEIDTYNGEIEHCMRKIESNKHQQKSRSDKQSVSNPDSVPIEKPKKTQRTHDKEIALLKAKIDDIRKLQRITERWLKQPMDLIEKLSKAKEDIKVRRDKILEDRVLDKELQQEPDTDALQVEMARLDKENAQLRSYIDTQAKQLQAIKEEKNILARQVQNLSSSKQELESEAQKQREEINNIDEELLGLKVRNAEYDKILLQLNGLLIDAIQSPITAIEQVIFNINSPDCALSPQQIAHSVAEPLQELREHFEEIDLNPASSKRLPIEYGIDMCACVSYDDWINKIPIAYDQDKHKNFGTKSDCVLAKSRGFLYIDNIKNEKVIKAETVSFNGSEQK